MSFDNGAKPKKTDQIGDQMDRADVQKHGREQPPALPVQDRYIGLHAQIKEDAQVRGAIPYAVLEQSIDKCGDENEEIDADQRAADTRGNERDEEGWRRAGDGAKTVHRGPSITLQGTSPHDIFPPG